MSLTLLKYWEEFNDLAERDIKEYSDIKLAERRVEVFLHFALYTICKIDYKRIGILKRGKRIRKGASGTRDATCDLKRIPSSAHPKGPPLSQAVIVRYYDLSRTRKAWRSFYRKNFISFNAAWSDERKEFTTDLVSLINEGLVPPAPVALSRSEKRKLFRVMQNKKVKNG
jgi:hypothetical protein